MISCKQNWEVKALPSASEFEQVVITSLSRGQSFRNTPHVVAAEGGAKSDKS
jgi:hypothetical protein